MIIFKNDNRKVAKNNNMYAYNRYIYIVILLIAGIITGGCISIQDNQESTSISNYHDAEKLPNFELKINGADDYSRQKILTILNHTDQNVVRYISSINIVTNIGDSECADNNSTGCAIGNFTINGKLKEVKIYVLDHNSYKGLCNTFEHTLYHEIGHAVYFYKFGDHDTEKNDKFYHDSLELYAEKYADTYSNVDKEGCDGDTTKKLENDLNEKEKVYQYAIKILSKWDKYKYDGVPKDMYDEYRYDYDLYTDAKKEYMDTLEEFKNYIKRSQE